MRAGKITFKNYFAYLQRGHILMLKCLFVKRKKSYIKKENILNGLDEVMYNFTLYLEDDL